MIFEDWRDAEADEIDPLYQAECRRYGAALAWDLAPSCAIIEEARSAGRLPGLVMRDGDGDIHGWTFFVVHEGILQIGGLVADSAAHLRRLLDHVLRSPEARLARALSAFLYPVSASLLSAFERQRFAVEKHPYLVRQLESTKDFTEPALEAEFRRRTLMEVDPADIVRLTAKCYAGMAESRCFAPDGRLDQWAHYLGQLLATPACGVYQPHASFAVEHRDTGRVLAAVITTAVASGTAHIAQIVVDPEYRRSGFGRHLIESVSSAARAQGQAAVSLIVSGDNLPARSLYNRLGFGETASFIFASRQALTRRAFEVYAPPARGWSDVAERSAR